MDEQLRQKLEKRRLIAEGFVVAQVPRVQNKVNPICNVSVNHLTQDIQNQLKSHKQNDKNQHQVQNKQQNFSKEENKKQSCINQATLDQHNNSTFQKLQQSSKDLQSKINQTIPQITKEQGQSREIQYFQQQHECEEWQVQQFQHKKDQNQTTTKYDTNQAMIRKSYLPQQTDRTFSQSLFKVNIASYLKNYLMRNTKILMNSDIHVKRISKLNVSHSFPSMSKNLRPKNYQRALFFDRKADVTPSYFYSSQSKQSRALAQAHYKKLQDFKRKVKTSKIGEIYNIQYDWQIDDLSLNLLKTKSMSIPKDECWIFLNHSQIKKSLRKLQLHAQCYKDNKDEVLKCRKISKNLKQCAQKFFNTPSLQRNNLRIQIDKTIQQINTM